MLLNRIELFAKFQYCKKFKKRIPIVVYLLITNKCQLRCRYCFVNHKFIKEFSKKQIFDLVDELDKMGTKMICLMGGEPLLHNDIGKIIDYIKSKGMICDITTNGLLVKNKIKELKNIDSVMISLDGNEEGNDINRGKGNYKKIIEGIELLRKNGILTRINCVLTRYNYNNGSIEHLLDLCNKYDMFVTFAIMAESHDGKENVKDMVLSDKEIKQLFNKIRDLKNNGGRIPFSAQTMDYIINYPVPYSDIIFQKSKFADYYPHKCLFGNCMCYIDSDGMVYPCATIWNVDFWKPKSFFDVGLKEAWNNMKNLPCSTCFCGGGPEWNYITSFSGLRHVSLITFKQLLTKNKGMST